MNYQSLIASIQAAIYNNGAELITGNVLQAVLLDMVNALDSAGATYGGTITPASAAPADLDQPTVYLALEAGTYTNYLDSGGNPIVTTGPALITYNGGASLVFSKTDLPSGGSGATVITNDGSDGDSVAIRLTDNGSYRRSFRIDMTTPTNTGSDDKVAIGTLIVEANNIISGVQAHGYYYGDTLADILAEVAVYQDDIDPDTFYLMLTNGVDLDSVTFAITPIDDGEVDAFITNAADDHTKSDDANITEIEKTSNKVSTISGNETSTTKYPNTKAVADAIAPLHGYQYIKDITPVAGTSTYKLADVDDYEEVRVEITRAAALSTGTATTLWIAYTLNGKEGRLNTANANLLMKFCRAVIWKKGVLVGGEMSRGNTITVQTLVSNADAVLPDGAVATKYQLQFASDTAWDAGDTIKVYGLPRTK